MHAIASAIAGIRRTSAAPTGSRTLSHLVLHRASSAAAAQAVGRPDQLGGPPAQPRAYAVAGSHRRRASSAAVTYAVGRPDQLQISQLSRGSTRWQALNQQPQTSPSRSVELWPRLPWSVGAAAGYAVDPPGNCNSQVCQLHRRSTRGRPYASSSSLVKRASPLPWSVGAAAGYAVDLPGNGPAPPQAMRGHSDRQQVDGAAADKQWSTWGAPQSEASVRVIPRAGAGPGCEATRPGTARAAGTKRLWQVGAPVLAGQGARATPGCVDGPCPAGLLQSDSESDLEPAGAAGGERTRTEAGVLTPQLIAGETLPPLALRQRFPDQRAGREDSGRSRAGSPLNH
jgi:hypothetical protein